MINVKKMDFNRCNIFYYPILSAVWNFLRLDELQLYIINVNYTRLGFLSKIRRDNCNSCKIISHRRNINLRDILL